MRKRKWRAKLLSEICPNDPSWWGRNVGGGEEVKLRLRRPNRDWDFYPFDELVDHMLHELCHNVHGPDHDAAFYRLWDELRKECEELMSKGISGTGQGFDPPGRRTFGWKVFSTTSYVFLPSSNCISCCSERIGVRLVSSGDTPKGLHCQPQHQILAHEK